MIRLIKAELKKLFHKKSYYIVTIIFLLFSLLINLTYKEMNNLDNYEGINITELEEENKTLDLDNEDDLSLFISNSVTIETEKLINIYKSNNERYLIYNYLEPIITEELENKYITKDEEKAKELENEKENILSKIKNNDWIYFVNNKIKELQEKIANTKDNETKERLEIYLELSEYRILNKIPFDNENYLNNAIEDIEINLVEYLNLNKKEKLTKNENIRLKELKKDFLIDKHILEEKQDINNNGTLRSVLQNFPNEFSLFILIYIIMICGSIVSEEFNKGTIKYLLTKPYKRRTILTSKLLTILIVIPLVILFMVFIELIIGGIILGFDSLNIPILVYNSAKDILVNYSCLGYLFLNLLSNIPIYLVLACFCFALSTITASTSAAITITFLFYLVSEVINNLVLTFNIKILKAFISVHWDFSYLVNYKENPFKFEPLVSIMTVGIYLSVILCLTYLYFNKKDVKNI